MTLQEMVRQAPAVVTRPSYLYSWLRNGIVPDLTVPNLPRLLEWVGREPLHSIAA